MFLQHFLQHLEPECMMINLEKRSWIKACSTRKFQKTACGSTICRVCAEGSLTFETSGPTWVSVQDVVLKQQTVHATKSIDPRAQPLLPQTHKQQKEKSLCSCRYGSCWRVTPWHKTDAGSPVDIFLSTSQKRSKTHVATKSLYIKTWFVCSNKFEWLKNVETFQAPKRVPWCLPQIC